MGEDYQTKTSKRVYSGEVIGLRRDVVAFPDGSEHVREVVEHPGAVGVLPVLDGETVLLVKQYRQPVGEQVLEIPAGLIDPGETPAECAARELKEETGYTAGRLEAVCEFFMSPGYSNERFRLFTAYRLTPGEAEPDGEEIIRLKRVRRGELDRLVKSGSIADAKTLIALMFWSPAFLSSTTVFDKHG